MFFCNKLAFVEELLLGSRLLVNSYVVIIILVSFRHPEALLLIISSLHFLGLFKPFADLIADVSVVQLSSLLLEFCSCFASLK